MGKDAKQVLVAEVDDPLEGYDCVARPHHHVIPHLHPEFRHIIRRLINRFHCTPPVRKPNRSRICDGPVTDCNDGTPEPFPPECYFEVEAEPDRKRRPSCATPCWP